MGKIKVAIYDEDVEYSQRLMNYLNGKFGNEIDATAFSKKEHLLEDSRQSAYDIIVTCDVENLGAVTVIPICEESGEEGYYRYGSARNLVNMITQKAQKKGGQREEKSQVIGVYTVSDLEKRTEFALEKAKELHGVYIGMEEYSSDEKERYSMEQLLFLIRQRDEMLWQELEDNIWYENGTGYLYSARCFHDYQYMSLEDYQWFIKHLPEHISGSLIFDIGIGSFSEFQFFSLFPEIYFIKGSSACADKRERVFLNLLNNEMPDVYQRLHFVNKEMSV